MAFCPALPGVRPDGNGGPLSAQEHIALREIEARIQESVEADEAKDVDSKMRGMAADATNKLLDGTILDRKQIEEGVRRDYDWILSVSDETRVSVTCLNLKGTTAIVCTSQRFVRMVPDRKDGSPHELITSITHREVWVYSGDRWLNKHIEELKRGPTYLDGEPYEP